MKKLILPKILTVIGTRPEAIKMASLIKALDADERFIHKVCVTGQHREMLDEVLDIFGIKSNFDLNIMTTNQNLNDITSKIISKMPEVFNQYYPDMVLVHGDTSTTFSVALASFFKKIKVGHIEAGLRTQNIYSPWPEEMNRKLTASLTYFHFAPTKSAENNLIAEGVNPKNIFITGNTVVDTLFLALDKLHKSKELLNDLDVKYSFLSCDKKIILVTGHRRENYGKGFEKICKALVMLAKRNKVCQIIYPVHLNPKVRETVISLLKGKDNIKVIEPVGYLDFVYLMSRSYLILTDSGGIQEEAPSLKKPLLVMRENTERIETLEAGTTKLIGTNIQKIISEVEQLLFDKNCYQKMCQAYNPYGDGKTCNKILNILSDKSLEKVND